MMKSLFKRVFQKVKYIFTNGSWKEKLLSLLCGSIILALTITGFYILGKLIIGALSIIAILALFFGDSIETHFKELRAEKERVRLQKESQESNIPFILRESLFYFLAGSMGQALGFQPPDTVDDITPVAYPVIQCVGNKRFYRFIAYRLGADVSMGEIRNHINRYFSQQLQAGNILIEPMFYKGLPSIYVTNIAPDTNAPGYLRIDMIFIRDESSYDHAKNLEHQERLRHIIKPPLAPLDKDF